MSYHSQAYINWHERHGKAAPEHNPHGTIEDIKENLKPLKIKKWTQKGNKLIGETDMGNVVNFLPTNVILVDTDSEGMPIFEKIKL